MDGFSQIKPKKWLGQHFLVDKNALVYIVRQADLKKEEIILEIGAGQGVLTAELVKKAKKVYAVEVDSALVTALNERFKNTPEVVVFQADALRTNLYELFQGIPFPEKMVSNLPYNLASTLILNFLESYPEIKNYLVMVQKEVAQRMIAPPATKEYGAYTLKISYFAEVDLLRIFPREIFQPVPRVKSALVRLERKKKLPPIDYPFFKFLVEKAFSHRRKKLLNNLVGSFNCSANEVKAVLSELSLNLDVRAENLSLVDYLSLANKLKEIGFDLRGE